MTESKAGKYLIFYLNIMLLCGCCYATMRMLLVRLAFWDGNMEITSLEGRQQLTLPNWFAFRIQRSAQDRKKVLGMGFC